MPNPTNYDASGWIRQRENSIVSVNNSLLKPTKIRSTLRYAFYRAPYKIPVYIRPPPIVKFNFTTQTIVAGATNISNLTLNGTGTNSRFKTITFIYRINNDIYIVDRPFAYIRKYNVSTTEVTTYITSDTALSPTITSSLLTFPNCLTHDPINNIMYIGASGGMLRVNMSTNAVSSISLSANGVQIVSGLVYYAGNLYGFDVQQDIVFRYNISTGQYTTIAGTIGDPGFLNGIGTSSKFNFVSQFGEGITYDSDGNLYLVDSGNNSIRKINTNTLEVTTFLTSTTVGRSIKYNPTDNLLYYIDSGAIKRVSLTDTSQPETVIQTSLTAGTAGIVGIDVYDAQTLYAGTSSNVLIKIT